MKKDVIFECIYETKIPKWYRQIPLFLKGFVAYYAISFITIYMFFAIFFVAFGNINNGNMAAFLKELAFLIFFAALLPGVSFSVAQFNKLKPKIFEFENSIGHVPLYRNIDRSFSIPYCLDFSRGSSAKNIVWVENFVFSARLKLTSFDDKKVCLTDEYYEDEYLMEADYFNSEVRSKIIDGYIIDNFTFSGYSSNYPFIELSDKKIDFDFTDHLTDEEKNIKKEEKNLKGETLNLEYFQNKQIEKSNEIMREFQECIDPDMIPDSVVERFSKMIIEYGILNFKAGEYAQKEKYERLRNN